VTFAVVHVARSAADAAGRAALRAHRACLAAGLSSVCVVLDGVAAAEAVPLRAPDAPAPLQAAIARAVAMAAAEAPASLSFAHPAQALDRHPLFMASDVVHLHGALPGLAPAAVRRWLDGGKRVAWSLHDAWPMTGGCHHPGTCTQWRTACMACPLFSDSWSLVPNAFAEKRAAFADPRLLVIAPTPDMAARATASAILGRAAIHVVPDPVDTATFAERPERDALRRGFGIAPDEVALLLGDGAAPPPGLPPGRRIVVLTLGEGATPDSPAGRVLAFGAVAEDAVRADILAVADLAAWPEDGAGDHVLETLAVGTPCVATGDRPGLLREARDVLAHPDIASLRRQAAQHVRESHAREVVGPRLAALYAAGEPEDAAAPADPALAGRIARALSAAPLTPEETPGPDFLAFPLGRLLAREPAAATLRLEAPAPRRLLALRSHHAHHATRSGPYQFLRHLPEGFAPECWTVPLGHDLAPQHRPVAAQLGRLIGARSFGHNANSWEAEAALAARCAAGPLDILHCIDGEHGGWLLPQLPPALFAGGVRPRLVATFHQPPALLMGLVNRAVLRRLDAVIVLCAGMRDALAPFVAAERLHVVPHGVDTTFYAPGPGRAPDGAFRLLAVGHWLRDYPAALAALALLREGGVDARLTIVWKDFPGALPPGVEVVHGLTDEALRDAYRQADALFLPLTDATANNAILEAMACGRPVVSTDVGGVRECVGDAAWLCPAGDVETMAVALARLAADPARRLALGRAARARAEALDWRIIAARHAAVYEALLAAPRNRAAA